MYIFLQNNAELKSTQGRQARRSKQFFTYSSNYTIDHECVQSIKSPDIFIIIIFVSIITIVIIIISKEVEKSLLTKE